MSRLRTTVAAAVLAAIALIAPSTATASVEAPPVMSVLGWDWGG